MISEKEIRMFLNKKGAISKEILRKLLEELKKNKLSTSQVTGLITLFGQEQFKEARKEVERYLDSTNALERYSALSTLVYEWGIQDIRRKIEKMSIDDHDEDVRGNAVSCLGSLLRGSNDKKALRLLLKVLKDKEEHWMVRSSAYSSILDIIGVPRQEQPGALGSDYEKYVDWKLIKSIEREAIKKKSIQNINNQQSKVQGAETHFFESPRTNKGGASKNLQSYAESKGIKTIFDRIKSKLGGGKS